MITNIVFDIGGTHMRVGLMRNGTLQDGVLIEHTPKDFDEGIKLLSEMVLLASHGKSIDWIAGGIAGPLDKGKTKLVNSPNLPGWVGKPLKGELMRFAKKGVLLENDTAIAGLGEAVYGKGKGHQVVAYMTISTGVGGVRIVNKKIDTSAMGFEPGHQIVDADGTMGCNEDEGLCLARTLDEQASGNGIKRRYHKNPEEINDPVFWSNMSRLLATGLNNLIVFWSPHVVVLGGPVLSHMDMNEIRAHLHGMLKIFPELPDIVQTELGDKNGLFGAVALIEMQ